MTALNIFTGLIIGLFWDDTKILFNARHNIYLLVVFNLTFLLNEFRTILIITFFTLRLILLSFSNLLWVFINFIELLVDLQSKNVNSLLTHDFWVLGHKLCRNFLWVIALINIDHLKAFLHLNVDLKNGGIVLLACVQSDLLEQLVVIKGHRRLFRWNIFDLRILGWREVYFFLAAKQRVQVHLDDIPIFLVLVFFILTRRYYTSNFFLYYVIELVCCVKLFQ